MLFHGPRSVTEDNNREKVSALPSYVFIALLNIADLHNDAHQNCEVKATGEPPMIALFTITNLLISANVAVELSSA